MDGIEAGSGGAASRLQRLGRPYDPARARRRPARRAPPDRPASSSARSSPPATRPRTCSRRCPTSSGRSPSPPPTSPSGAIGSCAAPCCGARRCRPGPASAGDPGLFVCATTTKAYDTDENRVLKRALHAVYTAARAAEHGLVADADDVVKRARHNGQHAAPAAGAPDARRRPGRSAHRSGAAPHRAGSRRATYRPASASCAAPTSRSSADHLARARRRSHPGAARRSRRRAPAPDASGRVPHLSLRAPMVVCGRRR